MSSKFPASSIQRQRSKHRWAARRSFAQSVGRWGLLTAGLIVTVLASLYIKAPGWKRPRNASSSLPAMRSNSISNARLVAAAQILRSARHSGCLGDGLAQRVADFHPEPSDRTALARHSGPRLALLIPRENWPSTSRRFAAKVSGLPGKARQANGRPTRPSLPRTLFRSEPPRPWLRYAVRARAPRGDGTGAG